MFHIKAKMEDIGFAKRLGKEFLANLRKQLMDKHNIHWKAALKQKYHEDTGNFVPEMTEV